MYTQMILVAALIDAAICFNVDGLPTFNDHKLTPTLNAHITEAGANILRSVNLARKSIPELLLFTNLEVNVVNANMSKIVEYFMEMTKDFEKEKCLNIEEKDFGRHVENNCYVHIAVKIRDTLVPDYLVVVFEKAYGITAGNMEQSFHMYQFFLGPLYFGVFKNI